MLYCYRIYHLEEGKPPVEQFLHSFSVGQQAREYSLLPEYLAHCLRDSGISATCSPDEVESNGVTVNLESDKSEAEVDSYLAKCLVDLNQKINGLCLVIDKRSSK